MKTLTNFGSRAAKWAVETNPFTNVYGLARTLLALSTLATLLFSHSTSIFCPASGRPHAVNAEGFAAISLFALLKNHLELARYLTIGALIVIATGWRPRYTAVVYWWIAFSLQISGTMVDGGDQIANNLAWILIPVALMDGRRWHWEREEEPVWTAPAVIRRLVGLSALVMTRVQMAGVYFHAAAGKMKPQEWVDGTALYYWLQDPGFGAPSWLMPVLKPLLLNAVAVTLMTWSVIVLELLLAGALFMPKRAWRPLLYAGILFHVGIAVVHGLISFALAMIAGLILYLREWDRWIEVPETAPAPAGEVALS